MTDWRCALFCFVAHVCKMLSSIFICHDFTCIYVQVFRHFLTFSICSVFFMCRVDFHALTQDPSRVVREGPRSILDPLKNGFPPYLLKSILGIGIAYYCLFVAYYCYWTVLLNLLDTCWIPVGYLLAFSLQVVSLYQCHH